MHVKVATQPLQFMTILKGTVKQLQKGITDFQAITVQSGLQFTTSGYEAGALRLSSRARSFRVTSST